MRTSHRRERTFKSLGYTLDHPPGVQISCSGHRQAHHGPACGEEASDLRHARIHQGVERGSGALGETTKEPQDIRAGESQTPRSSSSLPQTHTRVRSERSTNITEKDEKNQMEKTKGTTSITYKDPRGTVISIIVLTRGTRGSQEGCRTR